MTLDVNRDIALAGDGDGRVPGVSLHQGRGQSGRAPRHATRLENVFVKHFFVFFQSSLFNERLNVHKMLPL